MGYWERGFNREFLHIWHIIWKDLSVFVKKEALKSKVVKRRLRWPEVSKGMSMALAATCQGRPRLA